MLRKHLIITLLFVGTLLCLPVTNSAVAAAADAMAILKNVDKLSAIPNNDFSVTMTVLTNDPVKGVEKQVVRFFRRDKDDKFLLLFLEPAVQKGQGYLRIDDSLWFYDPESRKFTHMSMKENFGGTDMKNSDFGQTSFAQDYTVTSISESKVGSVPAYKIELKAKNNEVTYPYLTLWVNKNPNLVLKAEEYSLSKRLLRTTLFVHYTKVGSSYVADTIVFTDELVKGKSTQISLKDISVGKLPNDVFTKSYLERVNK